MAMWKKRRIEFSPEGVTSCNTKRRAVKDEYSFTALRYKSDIQVSHILNLLITNYLVTFFPLMSVT